MKYKSFSYILLLIICIFVFVGCNEIKGFTATKNETGFTATVSFMKSENDTIKITNIQEYDEIENANLAYEVWKNTNQDGTLNINLDNKKITVEMTGNPIGKNINDYIKDMEQKYLNDGYEIVSEF